MTFLLLFLQIRHKWRQLCGNFNSLRNVVAIHPQNDINIGLQSTIKESLLEGSDFELQIDHIPLLRFIAIFNYTCTRPACFVNIQNLLQCTPCKALWSW